MKKYYFAVIGIVAIVAIVGIVYGLSGKVNKISASQSADSYSLVGQAGEVLELEASESLYSDPSLGIKCNDGNIYEITSTKSLYSYRTRKPTSYIVPHGSIKLGIKNKKTTKVFYSTKYKFQSSKPDLVQINGNIAFDNIKRYGDYNMFIDITIPDLLGCNNVVQPMRVLVGDPFLGKNIAYIYPKDIVPADVLPLGQDWATISVGEMMKIRDVVRVTDLVYSLQKQLFGIKALDGDLLFFALQPDWCGGAGQPLGFGVGCLIQPTNEPQWNVIFHEMGHDFNSHFLSEFSDGIGGQYPTNRKIFEKWSDCCDGTFAEGIATLGAMYSEYYLLNNAKSYGINSKTYESIKKSFNEFNQYSKDLADYESQGSDFTKINANILDGIFISLVNDKSLNRYGWDMYPRFFKIYLDPLPSFVTGPLTEVQGHTYFVAGLSVASGSDLRVKFKSWGFPIDDAYYEVIHPELKRIMSQKMALY